MATNQPLPCPTCSYDLSAVQSDDATCPECGGAFSRPALAVAQRASVSLALTLLTFGALGGALMHAAGAAISYMPHGNEGSSGDPVEAALALGLLPSLGVAYAVWVLATRFGRNARERRWMKFIAGVFSFGAILRVSTAQTWGYADYSAWLQAERWRTIDEWGMIFVEGLLIVAGATALVRFAAHAGAAGFTKPLRLVMGAGVALILLRLFARAHGIYVQHLMTSRGWNPSGTTPFVETGALTDSVNVLGTVAWWLAWPALGLIALHIRALWRASQ